MFADRHTVSRLTYSISIDIHAVYQSRFCMTIEICMSIEILYVDRLLCLTGISNRDSISLFLNTDNGDSLNECRYLVFLYDIEMALILI